MIEQSKTKVTLLPEVKQKIDELLQKFPEDRKRSAVIQALRYAQDYNQGSLNSGLIEAVAEYLGIPNIAAYEVATFYSMYELKPIGKHKLSICNNISCMLNGSEAIIQHIEKRLNIKMGQTTKDGKFCMREAECLAACINAPMMQIDDQEFYEHLTIEKVDKILDELAGGKE